MRILLVSMFAEGQFGLVRYFERALRAQGHEVRFYSVIRDQTRREAMLSGHRAGVLLNRALRRAYPLGVRLFEERFVRAMRDEIRSFRPDVALTTKGLGLSVSMLSAFGDLGVPIYNYYPDPVPIDDPEFVATVPHYAGFLTYSLFQIPSIYWLGAKSVAYVPFASDPEVHRPKAPSDAEAAFYRSPVSYLATWQPFAEYWPSRLLRFGLKIWGNQWGHLAPGHPVLSAWQGEHQGTYDQLALVCGSSDVVFNMVRAKNGSSHSMKTFEIPASGGFMLTNRTEEQRSFFKEGVEAEYFSTEEELVDKVRFYLDHSSERRRIAEAGLRAAQNHLYEHRMSAFMDLVRGRSATPRPADTAPPAVPAMSSDDHN